MGCVGENGGVTKGQTINEPRTLDETTTAVPHSLNEMILVSDIVLLSMSLGGTTGGRKGKEDDDLRNSCSIV